MDLANGSISVDHDVEMSEKVLRTAQLEEILTQGEKSQSTNEGKTCLLLYSIYMMVVKCYDICDQDYFSNFKIKKIIVINDALFCLLISGWWEVDYQRSLQQNGV